MRIFDFFQKSNNLYFPGCLTCLKYPEYFELYKKIFLKLGIRFKIIDKKICCGLLALEAGYELESRKLARKNFDIFRENEIKGIITNSPCCYKMLLQNYSEILPDWNIKVENIWKIILEKLENKPNLIKHKAMELVSYHDSCYLGRHSKIYNEPRKILELVGYQIKEMADFKENAVCCGSCGGVPRVNPKLADKIAKQRLLQAKRTKVKKMVVVGLDNYSLLKENSQEIGIEILEFSEILAKALGIKIKIEKEELINDENEIILEAKANMKIEEELNEEDYYEGSYYEKNF